MRIPPASDALVERALAESGTTGCVAIVEDRHLANLRWADNTLTTNGRVHERTLTVVALDGEGHDASAGAVTRTVRSLDEVADLVHAAEDVARRCGPEESARDLPPGESTTDFSEPAPESGIEVFAGLTGDLGGLLDDARADRMALYGYAEHTLTTTYLGTSAGTRHRHVQPSGFLSMTAKGPGGSASTWTGRSTLDFADVDLNEVDVDLRRKLAWSRRRVDVSPGRYPAILPPTAVADLTVYAYWEMGGLAAHEGRTVFAGPRGGTLVGRQVLDPRLTLRSDPHDPRRPCSDVVATAASNPLLSVFDNGLTAPAVTWVDQGRLAALVQTRYSAGLTGLPVTPGVDNLLLDVDGATGGLDDLVARTDRGLLLTSLWYIREVDPQQMLLTGLTRDGVFVVEDGEVVGAATNFRFNESPVGCLSRVEDAGATVPTFGREWVEYFPRTAMPPLRVADFHFSTVSDAQ